MKTYTRRAVRPRHSGAAALLCGAIAALALTPAKLPAGALATTLSVGEVTGPDKPLDWRSSKTINSPEILTFRWSTTDPDAKGGLWTVKQDGKAAPVATGALQSAPGPGKFAQFSIDFKKFAPAHAPSGGLTYRVTVSSLPSLRAGAEPISTSSAVVIKYVKPGPTTQFDADMGFSFRRIRIELNRLDVGDEDDPTSNDEPYLVIVRFRMRTSIVNGAPRITPGTLQVGAVGTSSHNNLGRSGDNWCDEDDDPYSLPSSSLAITESVPTGQPGWVVGGIYVMFEEDDFKGSTAALMRDRIVREARNAISSLNFANVNSNALTNAIMNKIKDDLVRSLKKLALGAGDFFRALAEAINPNDFGGINVVMAATLPGGTLTMFAGAPPASAAGAIAAASQVAGSRDFALAYPAGDLSAVPWNARYTGKCVFRGKLTTTLVK
jgi:hypothetical protein